MAAHRSVLVGRAQEVETVRRFLDDLGQGARALVLEGEAGIGKTSVWREGVREAQARDCLVLRTRPAGADADFAFSALGDLMRDVELPDLPSPQRRAIAAALLLEDARRASVDRHAVGAALFATLRLLARQQPLVLAIDDAQWLDPASREALAFALRRLDDEPVGVLATVRLSPEENAHALVRALPDERVTRVPVGPLSVAALFELVRSRFRLTLSRATLLRLHESSGGNPFYALEIARTLARAGTEPGPGDPLPVPADLRELVRARLADLPPRTREVLLAASALSRPAVSLLERAYEDAEAALADAAEAHVVETEGDRVHFSHPLLASIHYEGATRRQRQSAHRRLARILDDPEERARHLALATDEPNEQVAIELGEAARAAERRGALAAAAELAELALERSEPGSTQRHGRTLLAAEFEYALGRTTHARALLDDALARTTDRNERAELLLKSAVIATEGESAEAAVALAHEGLSHVTDEALKARLLSQLALFGYRDGYDRAVAYGSEAIECAERSGDAAVLAYCLAANAWRRYVNTGEVLLDDLDRAAAIEEASGHVPADNGAVEARAQILADAGDYVRARDMYEGLLALARRRDDLTQARPLIELSGIDFELGRWESAAELAREAAEIAAQGGRLPAEGEALFRLALVAAGRGNVDETLELCAQSTRLLDASGLPLRGARLARGLLELSREDYETAWEYLDPSLPRDGTEGMRRPRTAVFEAVEALVGLGRLEQARELLEPQEKIARAVGRTWAIAQAAKCHGLLLAAEGDLAAAAELLCESVLLEEEAGRPFERARSLLALGGVQRRLRQKQVARATLREAQAVFEQFGARIWARRAEDELRRIGGRAAPAGRGLSATEERIVELAKAGHTNREIAELMSMSPKTIEWNLSKVYRKLGVRSRTELAARGH